MFISLETYQKLKPESQGQVYCYTQIINDQMNLFGFASKNEREFFKKLISVPGVGPKLAIRSLSQVSFLEFHRWILNSDEKSISGINGIGKKTAAKIILEIADKLVLTDKNEVDEIEMTYIEATAALEALGFSNNHISNALSTVRKEKIEYSLEELIKKALNILNKR